jgi:hypothetical protein
MQRSCKDAQGVAMHRIDRHAAYEPAKNRWRCKVSCGRDMIEWANESYPTAFEWNRYERDLVQRLDEQTARSRPPRDGGIDVS